MASLTWVGGGDNSVHNANDWSPAVAPAPGDVLYLFDGTANVRGGDLSGDTVNMGFFNQLTLPAPTLVTPVLNVSHGAHLNVGVSSTFGTANSSTINVSGRDTLNISAATSTHFGPTSLQINLHHHAALAGSINLFNGQVVIGGSGIFANHDSSVQIGSLDITPDMLGTGSTSLQFAHVETRGSVSCNQTFSFNGIQSTLTIDHPDRFHGSITGPTNSTAQNNQIDLLGVHADSYAWADDMLLLFNGDKVVEGLRLHDTAASTFVGQGASGVVVAMNPGTPPGDLTPLAVHSQ
jgi:hypothetical protein